MSIRNPSPMMRYWDWLDYRDIASTMDAWPGGWSDPEVSARRRRFFADPDSYAWVRERRVTTEEMIRDMPLWVLSQNDTGEPE